MKFKSFLIKKRAGKEQQEESSKKQKVEKEKESDKVEEVDDVDEAELKKLLVIKKDEDIATDAIPLSTKLPVIIDYKLHKECMMVHYQLIRADGSSRRYSSMIRMLQGIDREDLEDLWKIVKVKYGDIRPENEFKRVLWGDLKVMFEPDKRSDVWRILQGYRVTIWKLIDSSGVHFVRYFIPDVIVAAIIGAATGVGNYFLCVHMRVLPQNVLWICVFSRIAMSFDSNEEELVPKVDDVSLVDGVFNGAFVGDGEEDVVMGEGVVVTSSSLEMLTKSCLGWFEEDEDDKKSRKDGVLLGSIGLKWQSMRIKRIDSKSGLAKCRKFSWA
ncbi:hypothetical protein Tco_0891925 [Tanacetum coccineum]|uniref:Uncharacterized protein n=1 Tax=Tanacetum coccineum TaxID=301880 RepID=A0ABQ5C7N7_9ASTR